MTPQDLMICKGWVSALYPKGQEALASLLSPHDAQVFSALPKPAFLNQEHLYSDVLDRVHFSWLAPYLRTLAESEISSFLGALDRGQSEGLVALLGFKGSIAPLTKLGKEAMRSAMKKQLLYGQKLVPLAFLPQGRYNALLDITVYQLSLVVRYLGLRDLAVEMKQIIATKDLKKIFHSLTKKEGEFLNLLLPQQESLVFERLFLRGWDGTKEHLHKLLDQRGLCRLGHAVYGESDSFIWHLTHRLDIHYGALLLKYRKKQTHARGDEILQKQVETTLEAVL